MQVLVLLCAVGIFVAADPNDDIPMCHVAPYQSDEPHHSQDGCDRTQRSDCGSHAPQNERYTSQRSKPVHRHNYDVWDTPFFNDVGFLGNQPESWPNERQHYHRNSHQEHQPAQDDQWDRFHPDEFIRRGSHAIASFYPDDTDEPYKGDRNSDELEEILHREPVLTPWSACIETITAINTGVIPPNANFADPRAGIAVSFHNDVSTGLYGDCPWVHPVGSKLWITKPSVVVISATIQVFNVNPSSPGDDGEINWYVRFNGVEAVPGNSYGTVYAPAKRHDLYSTITFTISLTITERSYVELVVLSLHLGTYVAAGGPHSWVTLQLFPPNPRPPSIL